MVGWGSSVFNLSKGAGEWTNTWRRWLLCVVTGAEAQCCLVPQKCSVTVLIWFMTPSAEIQDLPREVFAVDPTSMCQTPNTEVLYRCRKCRYWTFHISPLNVISKLRNTAHLNRWACHYCQDRNELFPVSIQCRPQKLDKSTFEIQNFYSMKLCITCAA